MTKGDVDRLFSLLRELYPRQPQSETAERKLAWFLALEPYEYEAVRAAALAHARKSDYYPSVSEITAGLASPSEQDEPKNTERYKRNMIFAKLSQQLEEENKNKVSVSAYARQHGMTWEEARSELIAKGLYTPPA